MKKLILIAAIVLTACEKTAAPVNPLDAAARRTCMDTIEARATNRSSISYLSDDAPVAKNAKGQLDVSIKFSAKNELGMASTLLARCTVSADAKTLLDIAVKESR
jgi:hypothetical protein